MDIKILLKQMVEKSASDMFLRVNATPHVRIDGRLAVLTSEVITKDDMTALTNQLLGDDRRKGFYAQHLDIDFIFHDADIGRFRVNIFTQRGTPSIVVRHVSDNVKKFESLNLPVELCRQFCDETRGLVLVCGPAGSGKSTTIASMLNHINETTEKHIVTIEDPIEFLHPHRKATIHQRELYSDTPTFALALRAALRQAPKVILVGEMRDKETIEIALEAAETGHLVFSTLHTVDASRTLERIVGVFPLGDQDAIRTRFAKAFRYIASQRLMPRMGGGRVAAIEILISTLRTREYVEKGESEGKTLVDAMQDGELDGMQHFDMVIEKFIRDGVVDLETGLGYATNPGNLRLQMADFIDEQAAAERGTKPVASAAKPPEKPAAKPSIGGGMGMEIER